MTTELDIKQQREYGRCEGLRRGKDATMTGKRRALRLIAALFMTIAAGSVCKAQFYTTGDDPASVKWYSTETPNYKLIYPAGLDSLARVYGGRLEHYRYAIGTSSGFIPGECTKGKIPVILHAFNARSNGSVAWAPKRMDLFTSPQPYAAEALPWTDMLAIHEQRHISQMQTGLFGTFRPFGWFFGEMFNGLVAGLWSWNWFLEGDAVVAETALSRSGRGRTADFLNYYMIAFDNGDFRNWNSWRFGSQRKYAPDHYAAGYLLIGGIRFLYDYGNVSQEYERYISRDIYDLYGLKTVVKRKTGVNLNNAYKKIADTLNCIWQEEIESRKPFMPSENVVAVPTRHTEYSQLEFADNRLYAVKSSIAMPAALIRLDSCGREHKVLPFSENTSQLCYLPSSERLYWSENISDTRWSQKVDSWIRYYNIRNGKRGSITKKGRLFNPCPSPDESMLCTSEYKDNGRTGLAVIDAASGDRIASIEAPDTVQLVENVWLGDTVYSTGISSGGYGIYAIEIMPCDRMRHEHASVEACSTEKAGNGERRQTQVFGKWRTVLAPQPVQIVNFGGSGDGLHFVTDRTGVQEYYRLVPESGELVQLTSTRYGADDFIYSPDGKTLYYSAKRYMGNLIEKTPSDSVIAHKVSFSDIHRYKIADALSRQEAELAAEKQQTDEKEAFRQQNVRDAEQSDISGDSVTFSTPARYRKVPHLMRIHSWAPFYFNVDNIMSLSGEQGYGFISLGASALSQNDLGTAISQFGYSAHKDPYNPAKWRHSGHVKFTYSGLYPVLEASVNFNDRGARISGTANVFDNYSTGYRILRSREYGKPCISGNISMYIPFNFSRGGWYTGLVPKISYTVSNDIFNTGESDFVSLDGVPSGPFLFKRTAGKNILQQFLAGSVRFYTRRPVAESGVYPRWGFGAETGAAFRPRLQKYFSPAGYVCIYGYLPGIVPQHGFFLKALYQTTLTRNYVFRNTIVDICPQGLTGTAGLSAYIAGNSTSSLKLSADYGIPVYIGDLAFLGAFLYIKRLVITPHFDYTAFGYGLKGSVSSGYHEGLFSNGLLSAGATVAADISSLCWIGFPFHIGVTCSYNGGPSFDKARAGGVPVKHFFCGPVFSVSFN